MTGFFLELVIFQAVGESDAFPIKLVDRTVMSQPIQQGRRQGRITEGARPLGEWQVRGHDQRCFLVAVREDLEEKLRALRREGNVASLVHDEQLEAREPSQIPLQLSFFAGFDQRVHQMCGRCE